MTPDEINEWANTPNNPIEIDEPATEMLPPEPKPEPQANDVGFPGDKKPNSNKKMFMIVGIVVAMVLLVLLVYIVKSVFFVEIHDDNWNVNPTPTPEALMEDKMTDEMSDWQTHTSSSEGISFKFPKDWYASEYELATYSIFLEDSPIVITEATEFSTSINVGYNEALNTVTNERFFEEETLEEAITRLSSLFDPNTLEINRNMTIDGKVAARVSGNWGPGLFEGDFFVYTLVQLDGKVLVISLHGSEHLSIYDQILSTIEFTDENTFAQSTPPPNWIAKEYREVSLTVHTPSDWATNIESFPNIPSNLIRFWKTNDPEIVPIQLDIKENWENTGDAEFQTRDFDIVDGIKAYKSEPPTKEESTLERHVSLYFFERNDKVYVLNCAHEWNQDTIGTCENILRYLEFNE